MKVKYKKIINLLDNTPNQLPKFRTKIWVEINDESRGTYNVNSWIKFKTTMLKSGLCDYGDAYVFVQRTATVDDTSATDAAANTSKKKLIFKYCTPFTDWISKINNSEIDNAKDTDIVMSMFNLIKYSDNY